MPFGTIFAIFLIAVFIAVAIYAIIYFLNIQKCASTNLFVDELQTRIDELWRSQKGNDAIKVALPSRIKAVCFGDMSQAASGNETIYENLQRNYEADANLYFYPQKGACGSPYRTIKHINLTNVENPHCYYNGETIKIKKDYMTSVLIDNG